MTSAVNVAKVDRVKMESCRETAESRIIYQLLSTVEPDLIATEMLELPSNSSKNQTDGDNTYEKTTPIQTNA